MTGPVDDDSPTRASDAERARIVDLLVEHAAAGRLSFEELEGRLDEVHAARYLHELGHALRELPLGPGSGRAVGPKTSSRGSRRAAVLAGTVLAAMWLGGTVFRGEVRYIDTGEVSTAMTVPQAPSLPPPLPLPGLDQPAVPEAARWAVRQTFVEAFEPNIDPAAKATAVVRTPGMAAAGKTVIEHYPEAVATTTAHVGEIVFTSSTDAVVHFELRYTGGAPMGVRQGAAVFVDGRWKVTSETFCEVLAYGGGQC